MGMEFAAANIAAPFTDGVLASTVRDFTCTLVSRADPIPIEWCGRYVLITNESASDAAHVLFSKNSAASVNPALTAANDGGPDPARGSTVLPNASRAMRVPYANPGETVYFVRASSASVTLQVELSS
jgi:hypothetical protein